MKNVVTLTDPDDIHAYCRKLWKSDIFKKSHDEGGLIFQIIDKFARLPRIIYEPSAETVEGEYVEAPHFSPWWGAIERRTYANPAIEDLYHLHEIYHAATMPYNPGMNKITWKNKIRDNEHQASAMTEMLIYLEFPELRPLTFQHEILMDRYVFPHANFSVPGKPVFGEPNRALIERWKNEPDIVAQEMMYDRATLVTTPLPPEAELTKPIEFWHQKFSAQGKRWVEIWEPRYKQVEEGMVRLRDECTKLGRAKAIENHKAWLLSPEIADGTDIPFRREAVAFAEEYVKHKKKYKQAMTNSNSGEAVSYIRAGDKPTSPQP